MNENWKVEDVKSIPLKLFFDDRGYLFEVIRRIGDDEEHSVCHKFGQVYIVHNRTRNVIRAFHRHARLWDYFCIVHGSAKFAFVDESGNTKVLVLSARSPRVIVVPPTIWHGWMSLEDDTILLSVASETYNRAKPDEERVPFYFFDQLFGGTPWEVKFK